MTLTLTLTPEKESRLAAQARVAGLTLDDYVQSVVDRTANGPENHTRTGADLIAQWEREGAFLRDDDRTDSPELARQIRSQAWGRG